ncbi:MAG: Ldh family oxidoreductase [Actinomycetota bacterium]|nr:Ldh family oxidoreductase [Actinomycetota bacterium]
MDREKALERLQSIGFDHGDAVTLFEHFEDAERRGKSGHGFSRLEWLEQLEGFDPEGTAVLDEQSEGFERWRAAGTIGYVALRAAVEAQIQRPPEHARLVVVEDCFPTGMLGHYVRRLVDEGLVGVLTTTSPPRLGSPEGGEALASTSPIAIGIPSSDGRPIVADVSMGKVTYGDVLTGAAAAEDLVPFGGDQAHKAFALAVGLQLLVDALTRSEGYGAVLLVARPEADPVPGLRERAGELRLPGDR